MEPIHQRLETLFAERYLLRRLVEVDTVAETYVALDQVRQEEIIVKVLHHDITEEGGGFPELSKVLRRCSRLNHPTISRVFDFGIWNNEIYLTTELISGPTLRQELDRLRERGERLSLERITHLVNEVAQAMVYAHPIIAHGNLRPESIRLGDDGRVRLTDFGLSCLASIPKLRSSAALMGQAQYLAPELFQSIDTNRPATDWYALGVIWLETLGGNPLSGILSPEELPRQLPARTQQAITHLTASNPDRRLRQSRAIVPKLTPKTSSRPTLHDIKPGYIWGLLLVVLLGISFFASSFSNPRSGARQERTRSTKAQWTTRIHELDRTRHQLLVAALPYSEIRSALTNFFVARTEIKLADEIATAYESGTIQSPTVASKIETQLQQRRETLTTASNFIHQYTLTQQVLQTAAESSNLADTPLSLREWKRELQEATSSFNQGLFTQAASQCESIHLSAKSAITLLWQNFLEHALQAQSEWRQTLGSQEIPWIEPARSLSTELGQLQELRFDTGFPNRLEQLREIRKQYDAWVHALAAVPDPSPEQRINSIGMRFVTVDDFQCSVWETRIIDFAQFINETGTDVKRLWLQDAQQVDPTHPVTHVSRYNALEFCQWLTKREHAAKRLPTHLLYRLPTDREWSRLAGLPQPEVGENPGERHWRAEAHYPWGNLEEKNGTNGNYFTAPNAAPEHSSLRTIDSYHRTAPVGQFAANRLGLFDVGGNAAEWVHERWNPGHADADWGGFVARGGSWRTLSLVQMRTAHRVQSTGPLEDIGFRCVIGRPLDPKLR